MKTVTKKSKKLTADDLAKMKPSKLIRLALRDLEKCERSKLYRIDMGEWHTPARYSGDLKCAVCLAGSVMAQTCGMCHEEYVVAADDVFEAINNLRVGRISAALNELGIRTPEHLPRFTTVVDYRLCPSEFKRDMRSLAALLQKHGL